MGKRDYAVTEKEALGSQIIVATDQFKTGVIGP